MQCHKHGFEPAADICLSCGLAVCLQCLIYPLGPAKPGYCLGCAMAVSGVRHKRHAHVSSRQWKQRRRALEEARAMRPQTLAQALESPDPAMVSQRDVLPAPDRRIEWCA